MSREGRQGGAGLLFFACRAADPVCRLGRMRPDAILEKVLSRAEPIESVDLMPDPIEGREPVEVQAVCRRSFLPTG